jgi:hypothetical protein
MMKEETLPYKTTLSLLKTKGKKKDSSRECKSSAQLLSEAFKALEDMKIRSI